MGRPTPLWIRAVLAWLILQALGEWLPRPMPAEVRAEAEALRVELDPRRMCLRELRQLPGLGPTLALAVAGARDGHRAPWALFWEHVPGIGPVRARRIRAWLRARGVAPDPLARAVAGAPGYPVDVDRLSFPVALALVPFLAACREPREGAPSAAPAAAVLIQPRALLGGALHALEAGPASGAAVLLLHGARYSARNWQELGTLERLAQAGFHALALDWPGYGATPRWSDEPEASALLARVCDELALTRVVLIGPSLGGGFALEFAAAAPTRVAGLVLVAPAGAASFAPARWDTPTLLLWGDRDEVLAPEIGRALQQRLTGARLELLPGAGHPCYLEQPERFHELLFESLSEFLGPPTAAPGR
ncbi:MAG: alpha/beta fold hydrolase [Planctomycetota bacterium]